LESYGYSALNQLTSVTTYGYDPAENLATLTSGVTQTFDTASQLLSTAAPQSGIQVDQVVSADRTHVRHRHDKTTRGLSAPPLTTTSGNQLVLAFVAFDGGSADQRCDGVTGGGLKWTRAARVNRRRGTVEVWQAYADKPLTNAVITANPRRWEFGGSITVATFQGAAKTVGAVTTAVERQSAPTVSLTTTAADSMIWAVGHDWSNATSRTTLPGQTTRMYRGISDWSW
ncbi:MAG: hypothetical protein ACXWDF_12070, partial [Aeromicrobium sp.]